MASSSSATHRGPQHHCYLATDMDHDHKDPSYWQHRGEGCRVCARPKAGGGDVAEKSLAGRLCFLTGFWKS